jgi:NDP-sugar pyrophosphorylase family protein
LIRRKKRIKENGIKIVPVLDTNGKLVKVLNFELIKALLPIDAVIMAGGKGTRLMPLTENTPKPMLRIGDKPIIEYNIDHLKKYGIFNQHLSIKYLGDQLINYFKDGSSKDLKIFYINEDKPLGTIGAVSKINNFENDYILVMNSDILTDIDYSDLFNKMIQEDADMVVSTTSYDVKVPYGILETNGIEITNLVEKPTYTYHSNAGIYLIKREHLRLIPKNTHFNATELMLELIEQNYKVVHFPIPGYWLDIGKHIDFEKAQEDIKHLKL